MNKNNKIILVAILIFFIAFGYYFLRDKIFQEHELSIRNDEPLATITPELGNIDIEPVETETCSDKYNKLLNINKFDFDKYCISKEIRNEKYIETEIHKKRMNLVLILDASGSMKGKVDGKTKMEIAKKAAKDFVDKVSDEKDLELSVIVYGHKGSNKEEDKEESCKGIDEIYPLGKVEAEKIKNKIDSFEATGWTPIDKALRKARGILKDEDGLENFILLLSDGKETCGGNPVETIKEISKDDNLKIKVDVIGFGVSGNDKNQLLEIAKAGNGEYVSVKNALELRNAFEQRKKKLDQVKYKITRTVEQVHDISWVIYNYNQCRAALEEERAVMKLDINSSSLIGNEEKCIEVANSLYNSRYDIINNKIKNIFESDKQKFNNVIK